MLQKMTVLLIFFPWLILSCSSAPKVSTSYETNEMSQTRPRRFQPIVVKDSKFRNSNQALLSVNERNEYEKILSRFQKDQLTENTVFGFINKFPESPYAENAVYLLGMMELQRKNFSQSLKYFDLVLNKYPMGKKCVSAMFGKAMTYKYLNAVGVSKKMFDEVEKLYPGSPEAYRAQMESKLLEKQGTRM